MPEQHMNALALANRVRLARAATKRRIKAGEINAADVVREIPWETETMPVAELLRAQDRWGRTRTRRLLEPLGIGEMRHLNRLTERQRNVLANAIEQKQDETASRRRPPLAPSPYQPLAECKVAGAKTSEKAAA